VKTRNNDRVIIGALAALLVATLGGCKIVSKDKDEASYDANALAETSPLGPASDPDADIETLLKDPRFKKQFVAGYGTNSEIEPRIEPEEQEVLEKIQPMMSGDLAGAEAVLKSAIKPGSSAILDYTLAGLQFQQDRMPDALANYQRAVAKFPGFQRAYRNIGLIQAREGRHDEAIRAFTRMIELGGGDGYAYGLLGFAYAAKQDYQPAESAYRNAMLLQPDSQEWRLGLVRCVFRQGKFDDAASLLDALIAKYPDKSEFWLLQAQAYLGMKQNLKAAEGLEVVDRLGKATPDTLHTLGDIYVTEDLMDMAAGAYQRALERDGSQPVGKSLRAAEGLAARGALPQAKLVASRIRDLRLDGMEDADRRRLLKLEARIAMADGAGDDAAVQILDEIVKLDPLDGEALMLLGQHYQRTGASDRAIFYYERAANIGAFEVNAKVRHAQVLVGMGRFADAVPLLRRAQEIKPQESIARYLEQVERIARSKRGAESRPAQ
jgi:tetratricopeptide (TPR) repeat protein